MKLDAEILDRKNLSVAEANVLVRLCCAEQSKSIAHALGISIKTVEFHIDHIYQKMGLRWASVNRRSAAILIAIQSGMIKAVLHSVFAIVIFQACLFDGQVVMRSQVRSPGVVRVRRAKV